MSNENLLSKTLSEEDLHYLMKHGTAKNYVKNSNVISEHEESNYSFFIIKTGSVKIITLGARDREVIHDILGAGQCFGEIAIFDEGPRSATVRTLENSVIYKITKQNFDRCLVENHQLALKFIPILTEKIRKLTVHVNNLASLDVYHLIVRTLLEYAEKECENSDILIVKKKLTQQDIADMNGASREQVSRVMSELKKGGYIEDGERGQYRIIKKFPPKW